MSADRTAWWFGGFWSIAGLLLLETTAAFTAPAHVWEEVELTLMASNAYANPYTGAWVWVELGGPCMFLHVLSPCVLRQGDAQNPVEPRSRGKNRGRKSGPRQMKLASLN